MQIKTGLLNAKEAGLVPVGKVGQKGSLRHCRKHSGDGLLILFWEKAICYYWKGDSVKCRVTKRKEIVEKLLQVHIPILATADHYVRCWHPGTL